VHKTRHFFKFSNRGQVVVLVEELQIGATLTGPYCFPHSSSISRPDSLNHAATFGLAQVIEENNSKFYPTSQRSNVILTFFVCFLPSGLGDSWNLALVL